MPDWRDSRDPRKREEDRRPPPLWPPSTKQNKTKVWTKMCLVCHIGFVSNLHVHCKKTSDWTFHILSCNLNLNLSSHVVVSHDGVRTGVVGVLVIRINTCGADNLWTENLKSIPTKPGKIHQSLEETKVSKNSSAGYKVGFVLQGTCACLVPCRLQAVINPCKARIPWLFPCKFKIS